MTTKHTSHTPGPWKAVYQPNTPCLVESDGERVAWIDFWKGKTPRDPNHKPRLEQEANARLIAAAPELLEALQELLDPARGMVTITPCKAAAFERARAAIAKAKGEA